MINVTEETEEESALMMVISDEYGNYFFREQANRMMIVCRILIQVPKVT